MPGRQPTGRLPHVAVAALLVLLCAALAPWAADPAAADTSGSSYVMDLQTRAVYRVHDDAGAPAWLEATGIVSTTFCYADRENRALSIAGVCADVDQPNSDGRPGYNARGLWAIAGAPVAWGGWYNYTTPDGAVHSYPVCTSLLVDLCLSDSVDPVFVDVTSFSNQACEDGLVPRWGPGPYDVKLDIFAQMSALGPIITSTDHESFVCA